MKARRLKLFGLLVVVQILALEILLSVFFFHKRSEFPSAIVHYASFALDRVARKAEKKSVGIFQEDPKFGYAHKPNSTGRHEAQSFNVGYSIGSEGERLMPLPETSKGRVLLLGASFTFGFGVEDNESFPYQLGQGAWKDFQLLNKAVNGWGTGHAYMKLQEELSGATPPKAVVYGMIPDHVCRNYLRPAWLKMLAGSGRAHPHFELEGDKPAFQGVVGADAAVQDEGVVREKELALTEAFVREMHAATQAKGIPFFIVLLPQKFAVACGPVDWPPRLIQSFAKTGVPLVDLSELKSKLEWLEHDAHPTAAGQRTLAQAIAASAITGALQQLTED